MRYRRIWFLGCIFLALPGCASAYRLAPLGTDHPAHPEAMAASEPPLSKTLAYTPADVPSARPVAAGAMDRPEGHGPGPARSSAQQTAVGEGKVVAVVPGSGQLVLEHGEIKGFMEAMTMGYRTEPSSLLEGLSPGDRVRFTIDVPSKAIVKIEKLK